MGTRTSAAAQPRVMRDAESFIVPGYVGVRSECGSSEVRTHGATSCREPTPPSLPKPTKTRSAIFYPPKSRSPFDSTAAVVNRPKPGLRARAVGYAMLRRLTRLARLAKGGKKGKAPKKKAATSDPSTFCALGSLCTRAPGDALTRIFLRMCRRAVGNGRVSGVHGRRGAHSVAG